MFTNTFLLRIAVASLLIIGMIFVYNTWSKQVVSYSAINILAYRDPQFSLPIFAQFTATQTLRLSQIIRAKKLVVPMFVPTNAQPISVSLYRNGNLINTWSAPVDQAGIIEAEFPFGVPIVLDGELEILFDGNAIAYEHKDAAPSLFVEALDSAYPDGNYRIAQNNKAGDISLKIMAEKTNRDIVMEKIRGNPRLFLQQFILWVLAVFLVIRLPFVF